MHVIAICIHGHQSRKISDLQVPHSLCESELLKLPDTKHILNSVRKIYGSASDSVQIYAAILFQRLAGLLTHSTLTHYAANIVLPDQISLEHLDAHARCRAGCNNTITIIGLFYYGTAEIKH